MTFPNKYIKNSTQYFYEKNNVEQQLVLEGELVKTCAYEMFSQKNEYSLGEYKTFLSEKFYECDKRQYHYKVFADLGRYE